MKKYDVTLRGHYEKTISVYADSPEEAKKKTEIVLFDTDLIDFTDDDFVCGEADITESLTDGCEDNEDEDACLEYEDCSECPYFCPVCGEGVGLFTIANYRKCVATGIYVVSDVYSENDWKLGWEGNDIKRAVGAVIDMIIESIRQIGVW